MLANSMADTAITYGTSRNPSEMGRILSFIGRFTVDSTVIELLADVIGRKKMHKLEQQKANGSPPPPPLSLNYKRMPRRDFDGIVRDVQEIAKKGQEEAIQMNQLHEGCVVSLKGTDPFENMPREAYKESDYPASNRNRVFIQSRL